MRIFTRDIDKRYFRVILWAINLTGGGTLIRLKVREVAEGKGFKTPGHLARESRVSYATVHRLWNEPEKAEDGLTLGVLRRIAQALGVKISALVEEESGPWMPALLQAA